MSTFEETLALLGSAMGQMEALVALQTSSPISSIYRERDPMRRESMKESAETVIEQVDSQCSMLKTLSERLSSMYGKLHHKRKMLQNSLVPVSSLSEDLLEAILRMVIDSSSSKKFDTVVNPRNPIQPRYDMIDAIQLSHVCVTWRAVVQDNPLLKSYAIVPQSQIGKLKQTVKLLGKASKKPVTVHIIPPPVPQHSPTSIPQLQHLSISLGCDQAATYINHLWNTNHQPPQNTYSKFPNLLSLNMDAPCIQEEGQASESFRWSLPRLQEAHLHGCFLVLERYRLPSLRRLQLKRVTLHPQDLNDLRNVCGELESLVLDRVATKRLRFFTALGPQGATLTCPSLSQISISNHSFNSQELEKLLGTLVTPHLEVFKIGKDSMHFHCWLGNDRTSLTVNSRMNKVLSTVEINAQFMRAFIMIQNASDTIQSFTYKGPRALFEHLGPYLFGDFPMLTGILIEFNDDEENDNSNENNQSSWTNTTFRDILHHRRHQFQSIELPPSLLPAGFA